MIKSITVGLLAGASLLALTAHARADFIVTPLLFGGSALFATGATTIAGVSLATFASAALAVGSAVYSALGRKPDTSKLKNTVRGQEGPGINAFGRLEVEGWLLYGNTAGFNIVRLVAHAFGVLDRVEAYFYDGREITVELDGYVSSPPWVRPPGQATPSYMRVRTKAGDGTETAWDRLVALFAGWTSDHKVRGIAQSLLEILNPGVAKAKKFSRLLQGGVKGLRLRARMLRPWDPRTDEHAWTMNGVLHVLHYLRALNGPTDDDFDFDVISATADAGEVVVPTLTGTAPRCQLSGGWEGPITTDVVLDMMESAGLDLRQTDDGRWALHFKEAWPEPEITLTRRHIIDMGLQAGPESARRPNICRLTYFSPERRYEKAEIDLTDAPWARVQSEIDAYGDQEFACDLTFCCDADQAQRLAFIYFHLARADTGVMTAHWAGMAAWGKRTMLIEVPDSAEDGEPAFWRVLKGTVRPNDAQGTCEIPYLIIPSELETPFDPATMAVPAPPVLVPLQAESDLPTPDAPTGWAQVQYPGGGYELRVAYGELPEETEIVETVYRVWNGDGFDAAQSMTETGDGLAYVVAEEIGERVDFRIRIFDEEEEGSLFSDPLDVPVVAIDNTQLDPPDQDVTGVNGAWTVAVTVPDALRVASIVVYKNSPATGFLWAVHGQFDARPGVTYTTDVTDILSAHQTIQIASFALTSNGTFSDATPTFAYTEPAGP